MHLARYLGRALVGFGLLACVGVSGCAAELDVAGGAAVAAAPAAVPVDFHTALDPYGRWITVAGYGDVWQPSVEVVGTGFVPYATAGTWVSTDAGWAFESEHAWGWAPFHYGHWVREPAAGWVWVPGTTWTVAAVEWRTGGGFVGWAPAPPPGAVLRDEHFTFVETAHFTERNVVSFSLPAERRTAAFQATVSMKAVSGAAYARGPRVEEVAAAVGHPLRSHRITPPRAGVIAQVHAGRPAHGDMVRHEEALAREERRKAAQSEVKAHVAGESADVHKEHADADAERARLQHEEAAREATKAKHEEHAAAEERAAAERAAARARAARSSQKK
jgi:hypothetical protein